MSEAEITHPGRQMPPHSDLLRQPLGTPRCPRRRLSLQLPPQPPQAAPSPAHERPLPPHRATRRLDTLDSCQTQRPLSTPPCRPPSPKRPLSVAPRFPPGRPHVLHVPSVTAPLRGGRGPQLTFLSRSLKGLSTGMLRTPEAHCAPPCAPPNPFPPVAVPRRHRPPPGRRAQPSPYRAPPARSRPLHAGSVGTGHGCHCTRHFGTATLMPRSGPASSHPVAAAPGHTNLPLLLPSSRSALPLRPCRPQSPVAPGRWRGPQNTAF